jgi:hypothetical protein
MFFPRESRGIHPKKFRPQSRVCLLPLVTSVPTGLLRGSCVRNLRTDRGSEVQLIFCSKRHVDGARFPDRSRGPPATVDRKPVSSCTFTPSSSRCRSRILFSSRARLPRRRRRLRSAASSAARRWRSARFVAFTSARRQALQWIAPPPPLRRLAEAFPHVGHAHRTGRQSTELRPAIIPLRPSRERSPPLPRQPSDPVRGDSRVRREAAGLRRQRRSGMRWSLLLRRLRARPSSHR